MTTGYAVAGMTCEHCVAAVTAELRGLAGVVAVEVELHPAAVSLVSVTSSATPSMAAVAAAIDEAGYQLLAS